MTDAGAIYPGVRFIRTAVMLDENLVLFVDRVTSEASHSFDLATHIAGSWLNLPPGEPIALPPSAGYQHLADASVRRPVENITLATTGGISLVLQVNQPTDLITATGIGKSTEDRVPVVLFRRTGRQADFIWAASLDGKAIRLATVKSPPGTLAVSIGSRVVTVSTDPPSVTFD